MQTAALVAATVGVCGSAHGQQAQTPSQVDPAAVLAMPFDVTGGRASFEIVSRIGRSSDHALVRTHWVYWSADCRHLADVFISLTERDTVVVDPTHLQGQTQSERENVPQGPLVDLTGERGVVIVTAFDERGAVTPAIVGGWTIGDPATLAGYGTDAVGVSTDGTLTGGGTLVARGVDVPTFNPRILERSQVIVIGLQAMGGEITPITRASAALSGAHVCCAAGVTDNLELGVSIPDFCFDCAAFVPITAELADGGPSLLPPTANLATSGMIRLTNCRSANADGSVTPLGTGDTDQILIAFHAQMVGPFGIVTSARYEPAVPH